jgi:O-antigen/teichoic acid export membrane protein
MPMALINIAGNLQTQTLPLLLGYLSTPLQVSWLGAAARLIEIARLPLSSVNNAVPVAFADGARAPRAFRRYLLLLVLAAVAVAAALVPSAPWLLGLAFGQNYRAAAPVLVVLALDTVLALPVFATTQWHITRGRERTALKMILTQVVLQLLIGAPCIWVWGATGAALAMLAARMVVAVLGLLIL